MVQGWFFWWIIRPLLGPFEKAGAHARPLMLSVVGSQAWCWLEIYSSSICTSQAQITPPMSRHDLFKLVRLNHQTSTLRQYDACLEKFLEWVPNDRRTIRDYTELDEILTEFAVHVYESCSGANRHIVRNTKNALMLYLNLPTELFRLTSLSLKGWEKEITIEPKHVCPRIVAYGLAWKLIREGFFDMGVAVLLLYDCYLRAQDIRNLTMSKLLLETSGPFAGGVVVLGDARGRTKRGLHESLTIRLPFLILLLARLKSKRLREDPNNPSARVFPFASQTWRKKIHEMAGAMELGHLAITPHSLRHGGASQDYFDRVLTTQDIMIRGRWKTKKALQSYLRPGCILSQLYSLPTNRKLFFLKLQQEPEKYFNVPRSALRALVGGSGTRIGSSDQAAPTEENEDQESRKSSQTSAARSVEA